MNPISAASALRQASERPLRVAIPKGSLWSESVVRLTAAGLDTSDLADPGRHLILKRPGVEYIVAKPTDVPVYVAYGVVDCGIAGRDTLAEAGLEVVEMVDLGYGGCRFVVAGPSDSISIDERYGHLGVLRVATKYPAVAQAHFDDAGIQVEIVRLNGNIELAPLIGLADVIVDITATGATLEKNGLSVLAEMWPSTARFVGNPAAVRTDARVTALADALAAGGVLAPLAGEAGEGSIESAGTGPGEASTFNESEQDR